MKYKGDFTWWEFRSFGFDDDFGSASKHSSPHAVIEGVRCQAEQLVAVVRAQTVDEQREVNGHDGFEQEHAEPRLVLLPRRRQQ